MNEEIVRTLDSLGRIIIPIEITTALGWTEGVKISIIRQENQVVLQTFGGYCFLCGSEENIQPIHGKYVCKKCIDGVL